MNESEKPIDIEVKISTNTKVFTFMIPEHFRYIRPFYNPEEETMKIKVGGKFIKPIKIEDKK